MDKTKPKRIRKKTGMSKKRFSNTNFLYNLVSSLLTIEEPSNCLDWAEKNLILLRHEAQLGHIRIGELLI